MLYGDTKGNVTLLHFLDPSTGLFAVSTQDGSSASDKIHLILYSVSSFIYNNSILVLFSSLCAASLQSFSVFTSDGCIKSASGLDTEDHVFATKSLNHHLLHYTS